MGQRLVMTTRADESFGAGFLYDQLEEGPEVRLLDLYAQGPCKHPWRPGITWVEARRRHPNAYYRQRVPPTDVWSMPREPMLGLDEPWYHDPRQLAEHNEKVRVSLEAFLNDHLARLHGAMRSGWWIMGKVRVQVVECEPVPEFAGGGAEP